METEEIVTSKPDATALAQAHEEGANQSSKQQNGGNERKHYDAWDRANATYSYDNFLLYYRTRKKFAGNEAEYKQFEDGIKLYGVGASTLLSLVFFESLGKEVQITETEGAKEWKHKASSTEELTKKYCAWAAEKRNGAKDDFNEIEDNNKEAQGNIGALKAKLSWLFDFYEYVKKLSSANGNSTEKDIEESKVFLDLDNATCNKLTIFEGPWTGRVITNFLLTLNPEQIEKFRSYYFKKIEDADPDFKTALDCLTLKIQYKYAEQCIEKSDKDDQNANDTAREELLPSLTIIRAWLQKRELFSDSQIDNLCLDCEEILKNITKNEEYNTRWQRLSSKNDLKPEEENADTDSENIDSNTIRKLLENIKNILIVECSIKKEDFVDAIFGKNLAKRTQKKIQEFLQKEELYTENVSLENEVTEAKLKYKQKSGGNSNSDGVPLTKDTQNELNYVPLPKDDRNKLIEALRAYKNKNELSSYLKIIKEFKHRGIDKNQIENENTEKLKILENLEKSLQEATYNISVTDIGKIDCNSIAKEIAEQIEIFRNTEKEKVRRSNIAKKIIGRSIDDYKQKLPDLSARDELLQDYADMYSVLLTGKSDKQIKYNCSCKSNFSHNRIVFGAPGTGKSYMLDTEKNALLGTGKNEEKRSYSERVTFHSDYSYYDFAGSYKPVMVEVNDARTAEPLYELLPAYDNKESINEKKQSNNQAENEHETHYQNELSYIKSNVRKKIIQYSFVPGPFTRVLTKALIDIAKNGDNASPHLLIIDEINRARAAAVFGDTFQLLDRGEDFSSRYSVALSEEMKTYIRSAFAEVGLADRYTWKTIKEYKLPSNFYIWATMNSADQGVYPLDTAFKRRWQFEYIGINNGEVGKDNNKGVIDYPYGELWNTWRKAINEKLKEGGINEDKLLGPFFIDTSSLEINGSWKDEKGERFRKSFVEKVLMYLREDVLRTKTAILFKLQDGHIPHYSDIQENFEVTTKITDILDISINANDVTGTIDAYIKHKWAEQIENCFCGRLWNTWRQAINEALDVHLALDSIKEDDLIPDQDNENNNKTEVFLKAFVKLIEEKQLQDKASMKVSDFKIDTPIKKLFNIEVEQQYESISAYFQDKQEKSLDS